MSAKAGRKPNLALARIEQVVEAVLDFQFFHGEIHARQVAGFDIIVLVLRQIKGADVAIGLKIVQLDILGAGVRLTDSRQQRN